MSWLMKRQLPLGEILSRSERIIYYVGRPPL